jgi:hypothetical protein
VSSTILEGAQSVALASYTALRQSWRKSRFHRSAAALSCLVVVLQWTLFWRTIGCLGGIAGVIERARPQNRLVLNVALLALELQCEARTPRHTHDGHAVLSLATGSGTESRREHPEYPRMELAGTRMGGSMSGHVGSGTRSMGGGYRRLVCGSTGWRHVGSRTRSMGGTYRRLVCGSVSRRHVGRRLWSMGGGYRRLVSGSMSGRHVGRRFWSMGGGYRRLVGGSAGGALGWAAVVGIFVVLMMMRVVIIVTVVMITTWEGEGEHRIHSCISRTIKNKTRVVQCSDNV